MTPKDKLEHSSAKLPYFQNSQTYYQLQQHRLNYSMIKPSDNNTLLLQFDDFMDATSMQRRIKALNHSKIIYWRKKISIAKQNIMHKTSIMDPQFNFKENHAINYFMNYLGQNHQVKEFELEIYGYDLQSNMLNLLANRISKMLNLTTLKINLQMMQQFTENSLQILFSAIKQLQFLKELALNLGYFRYSYNDIINATTSLSKIPKIEILSLSNIKLKRNPDQNSLEILSQFLASQKFLTNLILEIDDENNFTDQSMKIIASDLEKIETLEDLKFKISNTSEMTNESFQQLGSSLQKLKRLKHVNLKLKQQINFVGGGFFTGLSLPKPPNYDGTAILLKNLSDSQTLNSIYLNEDTLQLNNLGIEAWGKLIQDLKRLEELSLNIDLFIQPECFDIFENDNFDNSKHITLLLTLNQLSSLKQLHLQISSPLCKGNDEILIKLCQSLQNMVELQSLSLTFQRKFEFEASGIKTLIDSICQLKQLTAIDLKFLDIVEMSDDILIRFAKGLSELNLKQIEIKLIKNDRLTEVGITSFFESIKNLCKLEKLTIYFGQVNDFTELGFITIWNLISYLASLEELQISLGYELSEYSISEQTISLWAKSIEALKNLQIFYLESQIKCKYNELAPLADILENKKDLRSVSLFLNTQNRFFYKNNLIFFIRHYQQQQLQEEQTL